jgi:hypothetical protein
MAGGWIASAYGEAEATRTGKVFGNMVYHYMCNKAIKEVLRGWIMTTPAIAALPNSDTPHLACQVVMTAVESGSVLCSHA